MPFVGEQAHLLVMDVLIGRDVVLTGLRHDITAALRDLGEDHCYDVLLVVTELVSNVLDHTGGAGRLRLLRCRVPCLVMIEVDDHSRQQPVHGRSRLGEHRGKGMVMVGNTTSSWGTRPLADGKTVFAVTSCAPPGECTAVA
ncbi:ATP-binding protein [Lentzea sp. NPDC060358]|uniref:ATP-binding protein n=1 Tax=Lentzea sp. NPDC060358 TaxID=3347103 RepID=UPI003647D1A0